MEQTYFGPKTIEDAQETIATYERRIAKRPGSAERYQRHIDQAKKVIKEIESVRRFNITTQWFK